MEDSLAMGFELDLLKGRTGEPIGTEKVWSGMTYVKTAMGWKPKGKIKEGKQEEVHQKRMPKLEQPSIPKEKQIENFADKAKDSQLEAAIKDPKQEEEVKKIAKEELEERKASLEEDLDKKKSEKKDTDNDQEEQEQRDREITEAETKEQARLAAMEGNKEEKASYELDWLNEDVAYKEEKREELIKSIDTLTNFYLGEKDLKEFKESFETNMDNPKRFLNVSNIMQDVSGDFREKELLLATLATQKTLVSLGKEMICLPFMYENYGDKLYGCYDYTLNKNHYFEMDYDEDGVYPVGHIAEHYQEEIPSLSKPEKEALEAYVGNSFYGFMTEYMYLNKDIEKMSDLGKKRGISTYGSIEVAAEKAESYINTINSYISENPISENVVLSRRVNITKNPLIFDQITRLKKGDVDSMSSIQSFSYVQKAGFGDYQITLLAKAGDPIANANNLEEFEYISKQGTQFRVLETGFNSMVIEFVSDKEDLKKSLESDLLRRLQLPKQRIS